MLFAIIYYMGAQHSMVSFNNDELKYGVALLVNINFNNDWQMIRPILFKPIFNACWIPIAFR